VFIGALTLSWAASAAICRVPIGARLMGRNRRELAPPRWVYENLRGGPRRKRRRRRRMRCARERSRWIAPECRKADDHMLRPGGNIVWQRGRKTHATKTIVAFVVQRRDVSGDCQF